MGGSWDEIVWRRRPGSGWNGGPRDEEFANRCGGRRTRGEFFVVPGQVVDNGIVAVVRGSWSRGAKVVFLVYYEVVIGLCFIC